MTHLENILPLIDKLNPVERDELLFVLMRVWPLCYSSSEHPAIVATPNVCGGSARLIRTRIPVWTLERMRQLGVSEADILRSYPTLRAADLVQAWSYVERHREEIEKSIRENDEE